MSEGGGQIKVHFNIGSLLAPLSRQIREVHGDPFGNSTPIPKVNVKSFSDCLILQESYIISFISLLLIY